jgi:hypothetical protein
MRAIAFVVSLCVTQALHGASPQHSSPDATNASRSLQDCSKSPADVGKFDGPVQVEFLPDGRTVKLLKTVTYTDPCGRVWISPKNSVVDGASIPQIAWSAASGPYEGKYRDASVIHDVACDEKNHPWQLVHEAFYFAMLARETPRFRAKVMYAAVYHFGPRWPDPTAPSLAPPPAPDLTEPEFRALAAEIERREGLQAVEGAPPMSLKEIETWQPVQKP